MSNKKELISLELIEKASECFKIMAHPMRLRILDILLQNDELAVFKIAEITKMTHSKTCGHLSILKAHGHVCCRKDGKLTYYKIENQRIKEIIKGIRNSSLPCMT